MVTRNLRRAARRPNGESCVRRATLAEHWNGSARTAGAGMYHYARITSDRLVHLAEYSLRGVMFSAFFAAADTAWRKGRTSRISFARHFAAVSFRLLAGFTLSAR